MAQGSNVHSSVKQTATTCQSHEFTEEKISISRWRLKEVNSFKSPFSLIAIFL